MPKPIDVKVTNLLLDTENPRLAAGHQSQPEAIHAVLDVSAPKTLALAEDIINKGMSPIERLMVMPAPGDAKRFVVLEGNRRVAALKMLAEPKVATGRLTDAQAKKLIKWSSAYRARGEIESVPCVLFDKREDADVWIERRHLGEQGGVGVVQWGATEKSRFDARQSGKRSPELQVLDFVEQHGNLDAETLKKLPNVAISSLKRLVRDKYVRDALGIGLADGEVTTTYPNAEVVKGLKRIISDLAREKIKVADIYTAPDRKRYISKLKPGERPAAATSVPGARLLLSQTAAKAQVTTKSRTGRHRGSPRVRGMLIPSNCNCEVKGAKLRNIYIELRQLKLEDFSNAVSVLLRVFLELSVDDVIEKEKLMTELQAKGSKLRDKVTRVADFLLAQQRLSEKCARSAKKVANDRHILGGNITSFHEYVHNKELAASPTDLRTAWDNLQPLFEAIWPRKGA